MSEATRRDFLKLMAWGFLGAGAVGAGIATLNLLRSTAPEERLQDDWKGNVPLRGDDGRLLLSGRTLTKAEVDAKAPLGGSTGLVFLWEREGGEVLPGIVVRDAAGEYRASSLRCTHLSCTVSYAPADDTWRCPCHLGAFEGTTGKVLGGPPPKPLQQFAVRTEEGDLALERKELAR